MGSAGRGATIACHCKSSSYDRTRFRLNALQLSPAYACEHLGIPTSTIVKTSQPPALLQAVAPTGWLCRRLRLGTAFVSIALAAAVHAAPPQAVADFGAHAPSPDTRHLADWIAASHDHGGLAFVIIDKKKATAYVFDGRVRLQASSAVLLGSALGDDSAPGIGDKPIASLRPEERTTPAGRFLAERGRNLREDVVWVDYDAAVSMHRVLTSNPAERRLERLATPSIDDNRISSGCINLPVAFYETQVRPIFASGKAMVYVLPDVRSLKQVFGVYGYGFGDGSQGLHTRR